MKSIISAIFATLCFLFSYWLTNYFNIAKYLSFIPEDKKTEVSVSVYIFIISNLLGLLKEKLDEQRSKISIIIQEKDKEPNLSSVPEFLFSKDYQTSEFFIHFTVSGKIKSINESILVLDFPGWVQPQHKKIYQEKGSYKIKLKEVLGITKSSGKIDSKNIKFPIPIICIPNNCEQKDNIQIYLEKVDLFCKVEKNSFILRNKL